MPHPVNDRPEGSPEAAIPCPRICVVTEDNASDLAIAERVLQALFQGTLLLRERIRMSVAEGHVTLTGTVASDSERTDAERIVSKLDGVVGVTNLVAVQPGGVDRARLPRAGRRLRSRRRERRHPGMDRGAVRARQSDRRDRDQDHGSRRQGCPDRARRKLAGARHGRAGRLVGPWGDANRGSPRRPTGIGRLNGTRRAPPVHDRIAASLTPADDRLVLSHWLPPQEGIVPAHPHRPALDQHACGPADRSRGARSPDRHRAGLAGAPERPGLHQGLPRHRAGRALGRFRLSVVAAAAALPEHALHDVHHPRRNPDPGRPPAALLEARLHARHGMVPLPESRSRPAGSGPPRTIR